MKRLRLSFLYTNLISFSKTTNISMPAPWKLSTCYNFSLLHTGLMILPSWYYQCFILQNDLISFFIHLPGRGIFSLWGLRESTIVKLFVLHMEDPNLIHINTHDLLNTARCIPALSRNPGIISEHSQIFPQTKNFNAPMPLLGGHVSSVMWLKLCGKVGVTPLMIQTISWMRSLRS